MYLKVNYLKNGIDKPLLQIVYLIKLFFLICLGTTNYNVTL